jgi:hypothetical protein
VAIYDLHMPEAVDRNAELTLSSLAVAVASGQYRPGAAVRRALADLAAAVARADRGPDGAPSGAVRRAGR